MNYIAAVPASVSSVQLARVSAVLVIALAAIQPARADVRGVFRLGVEPLALEPSADTPYIGEYVDDAITAYNAASTAYNRAHNYPAGSPMAAAPIDTSALALRTTLVTFAPGIDAGGEHIRFRAEALIGISDQVRAYGIGLYPIHLALPLREPAITPYVAAGGTLRWLDRTDTDGETGGLVTVRAALGARFGRYITAEIGVGLFMLGGLYNGDELESMVDSYNPRGNTPPPDPERVVSGGTQVGMIDASIGFSL